MRHFALLRSALHPVKIPSPRTHLSSRTLQTKMESSVASEPVTAGLNAVENGPEKATLRYADVSPILSGLLPDYYLLTNGQVDRHQPV